MINCKHNTYTIIFALTLSSLNLSCMESFLPTSIGGYRIQSTKDRNTIITASQDRHPDGIIYLLGHVMRADSLNRDTIGDIACIQHDFSVNQSLFLVQLIGQLAEKTEHDSAEILEFINKQRTIYAHKNDQNKTDIFLKSFDEAKKKFYFLPPILSKVTSGQTLTQQESDYLTKNMYLVNSLPNNSQFNVNNPLLIRIRQTMQNPVLNIMLGVYVFSPAMVAYIFGALPQLINLDPVNSTFYGLFTVVGSAIATKIVVDRTLMTTPAIMHITVPPHKEDDYVHSVEDMDELIGNTSWLDQ